MSSSQQLYIPLPMPSSIFKDCPIMLPIEPISGHEMKITFNFLSNIEHLSDELEDESLESNDGLIYIEI